MMPVSVVVASPYKNFSNMLCRVLSREGFIVRKRTAKELAEDNICEKLSPAVVLVDDFFVCEYNEKLLSVFRTHKDIFFIAMSSYIDPILKSEMNGTDNTFFILKPFDLHEFAGFLAGITQLHKQISYKMVTRI